MSINIMTGWLLGATEGRKALLSSLHSQREEKFWKSEPFLSALRPYSSLNEIYFFCSRHFFSSAFSKIQLTGIRLHISNSEENSSEHFGSSFKYGGSGGGGMEKSGGGANPHSMSQSKSKSMSNFFHIPGNFARFYQSHMNPSLILLLGFLFLRKNAQN